MQSVTRLRGLLSIIMGRHALLPMLVHAPRSGCHRLHSCASDRGTYICGDLDHCSQCLDGEAGHNRNGPEAPQRAMLWVKLVGIVSMLYLSLEWELRELLRLSVENHSLTIHGER